MGCVHLYPDMQGNVLKCHARGRCIPQGLDISEKVGDFQLCEHMWGRSVDIAGHTGEEGTKMDKQDNGVKGNDIVIIVCMVIATLTMAVLLANLPFGTVG